MTTYKIRTYKNYIYFFTGILGNWYKSKIIYNNNKFFSSEQLFMYLKAIFFKDEQTALKILNCKTSRDAKDLGRQVKKFDNKIWETERENAMYIACLEKFQQNIEQKEFLLSTNDKILVEGNKDDVIWAVGLSFDDPLIEDEKNWRGLNLLGKVLMKVRNDLK
jgi:ribA/ribD-fused uncharacterized protein